jgi:hypothetical protein
MIEVTPLNNKRFDIKVKSSGKRLGTFQLDINGYYYFHPLNNDGVWSSDALIEIGKELVKLNEELDEVSKFDETEWTWENNDTIQT